MRELLLSGLRRYRRSYIFWLSAAMIAVLAAACGYEARICYVNLCYILAALVVEAFMLSWLVGREYEEGIFRNKVISGHSKGSIFLSELILGIAASIILYLLFSVVFFSFNGYLLENAPAGICIKVFLGLLAASICVPSVFVSLACLICSRAVIIPINMVLISAAILLPSGIQKKLSEPEYIPYTIKEVWSGAVDTEVSAGTVIMTRNADYVEEPCRSVLRVICRISPCGSVMESFNLTYDWFGYELASRIDPFHEQGVTWESTTDFTVSDGESHSLTIGILWTCAEIIAVCCSGFLIFRKKDLK